MSSSRIGNKDKEHYNRYKQIEYEPKEKYLVRMCICFGGIFYSNCVYILFVFIKSTKNTYIMNIQYN